MRTAVTFVVTALVLGALLGGGAGCGNDIDPDTLVRELRVLAIRFGEPTAGSVAEVQATIDLSGAGGMPDLVFSQPQIQLKVLAVAPTGPGRRVTTPGPRPLQYDWFACLGQLSLFSPGTLDPDCRKFAPGDPAPRQNPVLKPLVAMPSTSVDLTLETANLKETLGAFLQVLLAPGSGGTGSGGTVTLPTRPITLLLPVLVQVSVVGGDPMNPLDSEVAYSFLRILVALPGMTLPPPNRNPSLPVAGGVQVSGEEMGAMTQLVPCADAQSGDCPRYAASRTAPLFVTATAQAGSVETYMPLDDSGRTDLLESMRYSWFSTDGIFDDARTGDQHPQTQWKNDDSRPAAPETQVVDLWLVVQDERGGADFQRFQLSLP